MINIKCINKEGSPYSRGIAAVSIKTVTEHDESSIANPKSWIKFWDGSKAVSVVATASVADITRKVFIAKHGKLPAANAL
tara:strand:- start:1896 stop:2135 length:240 start_codon:yes stop_codon:yes gene_type:complete